MTKKFAVIADFDVGVQRLNQNFGGWWGSALIARFQFNRLFSMAGRAEYYYDKQGFVTSPVNVTTGSFSLNLDYRPIPILLAPSKSLGAY
ncbi:MAG: outer membrane beta-barrel protein [Cytophagales bacterium]|nr:outer membrane beta-barrel protein [Cytophagales bacterium]